MNLEYQKWMLKLMRFQFEIQYRPRLENKATDGLSRISHSATLLAITIPIVIQLDQLTCEVEADEQLQRVVKDLQHEPSSQPDFQIVNNQLIYKGRLFLPKGSSLIPLLLHDGHDGSMGGH